MFKTVQVTPFLCNTLGSCHFINPSGAEFLSRWQSSPYPRILLREEKEGWGVSLWGLGTQLTLPNLLLPQGLSRKA